MSEFTSPAVQAMNLIRYIGDQVSESGKPIPDLDRISKKIGVPSEELAKQLTKELHEHDLIRDAKFVIADLTHDNNGAYWEAGYAEGLGKPVIYICEKEKFESDDGTHFDTNHCTTVFWSKCRDNDDDFRQELTATLRRSLDES